MIKKLSLKNFKCYEEVELALSKINIITGTNSSGKSTLIQALKLYEETNKDNVKIFKDTENKKRVLIDLTQNAEDHFIGYNELLRKRSLNSQEFKSQEVINSFSISIDKKTKEYFEVVYRDNNIVKNNLAGVKATDLDSNNFYFIHADRYFDSEQKTDCYSKNYVPKNSNKNIADYIYDHSLNLANSISENLSDVLRNIGLIKDRLQVEKMANLYNFKVDGTPIELVGSGVRYTIPILLTVMTNRNSVICIENPELHLHPKAQTKLMNYLIEICEKNDNQLIIETHSDHIINSICVYIKENSCNPLDFSTFFIKDHNIQLLPINTEGKFTETIPDFFDEYEIQLEKLIW